MTRIKLLASVVTFGIVVLWCGTAFAGTITSPTGPFTAPLNSAGTEPAPFAISVSGYTPFTQVFVMICDGTPSTAQDWDPNINCDNSTSPEAAQVQADGTAMWNPVASANQDIVVFDGESPGETFNCFYPGEKDNGVAYSNGEMDPNDDLPSWTNCQIRVASTNGAITSDQAFLTMTLPVPTGVTTTTTTTTTPATTTTTVAGATTTTTKPATTTTTTTLAATTTTTMVSTTTTTTKATTTTTVGGSATTTTSTTVGGSTTNTSTTLSGATTTSSTTDGAGLAVTGVDTDGLVILGLCLIVVGLVAKSRRRA